jgi:hypothetical protein
MAENFFSTPETRRLEKLLIEPHEVSQQEGPV